MDIEEALRQLGGVAGTGDLLRLSTRHQLRTAVTTGRAQRLTRGRYALLNVVHHRVTAARMSGVLSHLGAAQHWGWPVMHPPERACVTVPRNRKVGLETQARVHVSYADLPPADVVLDAAGGVTSPLRTVLDCARRLPFAEALAVADSALRAGVVTPDELCSAATRLRGRGAVEARRVVLAADARAANPFESALRAIVLDVGGFDVVPQAPVVARGTTYHPDLVDRRRRIVIEADSYGFHADGLTFGRGCVRYSAMAVDGWIVLRFTWQQVMGSPAYVRGVLEDALFARASAC